MFSLYQSLGSGQGGGSREPATTGHDRFGARPVPLGGGSPRSSRRRRARAPTRRTRSAADLSAAPRRHASAPGTPPGGHTPGCPGPGHGTALRRQASQEEHTPLLARFFSCVALSTSQQQSLTDTDASHMNTGAYATLRHGGRYEYTALEADAGTQERLQQERKARERARAACLHYLRACPRYSLVHHLNDIGSRVDKHWFLVRDTSVKTERLLTLVPRAAGCPLACSPATRATILELFHALQHPYIYPVLDLDFRDAIGQSYVILVLPFNSKGSLKDLIYKSRWQDDWSQKYGQRSEGLPVWQLQRLGRQILEALLFLRERGFPPLGHLHSGNVILQNGVARLTGLENTLLGHTSRVHPIVWGLARADPAAVDVVCFGHVLFEMCAGYELCAPRPSSGQLADVAGYPAVHEILELIFQPADGRFPALQDLLLLDFFRNIDLREMRAAPLPQAFRTRMTTSTLNLLSEIRRHQSGRRTRRCHSASTSEEPSPPPRERRGSAGVDAWDVADEEAEMAAEAVAAAAGGGADADDEDDEPDEERQTSPAQEHRDLSLHRQAESPVPLENRCLFRHTRARAARDSEDFKCD